MDEENESGAESRVEAEERFMAAYQAAPTIDFVRRMVELRAEKDALEEKLKGVNLEFDIIRMKIIPERFDEEGIKNLNINGIGRVSLTADLFVSIAAGKKEQAYDYLRDIGKGSLITPNVNPSTLKAAVKAMLKAGTELPEELFKVTPFTRASITKG